MSSSTDSDTIYSSSPDPSTLDEYSYGFPTMDSFEFQSGSEFNFGMISGLYKIAEKSLNKIYKDFRFVLNADNLLDLENLDIDNFFEEDGFKTTLYVGIWGILGFIFMCAGFYWCGVMNRCRCCCIRKQKPEVRASGSYRLYNENDAGDKVEASETGNEDHRPRWLDTSFLMMASLMGIWLLCLFIITVYTFGANEKIREGVNFIPTDLNNAIVDINGYIGVTLQQLLFTFIGSTLTLNTRFGGIMNKCDVPPSTGMGNPCEETEEAVFGAINSTARNQEENYRQYERALEMVRAAANAAKDEVDTTLEKVMTTVADILYWFFMAFNLIYLLVFGLLLTGILLVALGPAARVRKGFILMRIATVLMILTCIIVVVQILALFTIGGLMSEVVCPAVRGLEDGGNEEWRTTKPGRRMGVVGIRATTESGGGDENYTVPGIGDVLRRCKLDRSAYVAFYLEQVFSIDDIDNLRRDYETSLPIYPYLPPEDQTKMEQIRNELLQEVDFYTGFIKDTMKTQVGKCLPAYKAINATLSLFCYKVAGPVTGFWWILQFLPPLFLLIVITAVVFEKQQEDYFSAG